MNDRPAPRATLRIRSVFISDVHLGFKGCQASYLLDFLRRVECDQIYLVGDIIDVWALTKSFYWPQAHNAVIRTILGKAKHGTRVIYVTENSDVKHLKASAPEATYIGYPNSKEAVAALKAGKGDVFTQVVTHLYRTASQDPEYVVVSRFTDKPYMIAVKKGDTVMRDYVNDFVRSMKASGELDRLFAKWFVPYGGLAAK